MKRLVCEMCGSTDLVKTNGVFVCQSCGCQYSVEDAKKMMIEGTVEVTGTVQVDDSAKIKEKIDNYLSLAEAALESNDISGTTEYCDKVLELDTRNYEAWAIRAKAVGWGSSLRDNKIPQAVTAAKRAIELTPEDKKHIVADSIYLHIGLILRAYFWSAYQTQKPTIIDQAMMEWLSTLQRIPYITKKTIEKEIAYVDKLYKDDQTKIDGKYFVAATAVKFGGFLQAKKTYADYFREELQSKMASAEKHQLELEERRNREKKQRRDAYWESHQEEKKALDEERNMLLEKSESLNSEIKKVENEIAGLPSFRRYNEIKRTIANKKSLLESLGLFKSKEKKTLQEEIGKLDIDMNNLLRQYNSEREAIETRSKHLYTEMEDLKRKLAEVEHELDKDR